MLAAWLLLAALSPVCAPDGTLEIRGPYKDVQRVELPACYLQVGGTPVCSALDESARKEPRESRHLAMMAVIDPPLDTAADAADKHVVLVRNPYAKPDDQIVVRCGHLKRPVHLDGLYRAELIRF